MSKFEEHLPSTADDEKLARRLQSEWEHEEQRQSELYDRPPPVVTKTVPSAAEDEELARKLQAKWNSHRGQDDELRATTAVRAQPKQVTFAAAAPRQESPPPPPQMTGALHPNLRYSRDTTRVMAYMIPLPQPLKDGVPQDVPQRYMLYMPPAPDLLKPADKSGTKERKRDKAVRRWQHEVRKAKTYNGRVVSLGGIQSVSIRGAVWVLSVIRPADVTFLSRVPRGSSVRSLVFVHPEGPGGAQQRRQQQTPAQMFDTVKGELSRTKSRTKRDFWIGTALLPITFTIDLLIPVFGGLSEVNMVWMAVNASAWMTANKVVGKLRPADGGGGLSGQDGAVVLRGSSAVGGGGTTGTSQAPNGTRDDGGKDNGNNNNTSEKGPWFRNINKNRNKEDPDKTIQMVFQPSPAMDLMRRYVEEACHRRNPDAFPGHGGGGGYVPGEAEVLASMGWSPEHREVPDAEDDVAWQIRKVTEDLREATNRAAKSWDGWSKKYMKNPRKAAEDEEKDLGSDDDDSDDEEELKPELPKRPPVQYR